MTGITRTQLADPRTLRKAAAGRKMNKSEAQALTAQIRSTAHGLWQLVAEAYDRKAWQALGYSSWKDYATDELQMSESRSYQLVDTGRVMKAIGQAAGSTDVFEQVVITARETAKIKPHLSTFQRDVKRALKDGMAAAEAVEQAILALPVTEPRAPRVRANVVEGEIVEAPEPVVERPLPDLGMTRVPAPSATRTPIPAAVFSSPAQPETAASRPRLPRGKKVCTTCDGHGYV